MERDPRKEHEKPLKTVFFGTGNYANLVMEGLRNARLRDRAGLNRAVARKPEKLREFGKRHGFEGVSGDSAEMLDMPSDLKVIVTPAPTHAEFVERANSSLVWVEKPIAENFTAAKHLLRRIEEQGKVVAVDYTFNNDGALRELADIVRRGETGKINSIHAHFLRSNFADVREDQLPFPSYKRASLDLAPHIIAGFNLMGLKVVEVKNDSLAPPEEFARNPQRDGGVVEIKLRDERGNIVGGKIDISMSRKAGEKTHSNGFEIYSETGKWFWRYDVDPNEPGGGKANLWRNPAVKLDADDVGEGDRLEFAGNNRLEMLGRQWDKVLGLRGKTRGEAVKILGPSSDVEAVEDMYVVEAIERSTRQEKPVKVEDVIEELEAE